MHPCLFRTGVPSVKPLRNGHVLGARHSIPSLLPSFFHLFHSAGFTILIYQGKKKKREIFEKNGNENDTYAI